MGVSEWQAAAQWAALEGAFWLVAVWLWPRAGEGVRGVIVIVGMPLVPVAGMMTLISLWRAAVGS